jgi:hypothetical protein
LNVSLGGNEDQNRMVTMKKILALVIMAIAIPFSAFAQNFGENLNSADINVTTQVTPLEASSVGGEVPFMLTQSGRTISAFLLNGCYGLGQFFMGDIMGGVLILSGYLVGDICFATGLEIGVLLGAGVYIGTWVYGIVRAYSYQPPAPKTAMIDGWSVDATCTSFEVKYSY